LSPLTKVDRQMFISATRKCHKKNRQDTSSIHACQKINSSFQSVSFTSGQLILNSIWQAYSLW